VNGRHRRDSVRSDPAEGGGGKGHLASALHGCVKSPLPLTCRGAAAVTSAIVLEGCSIPVPWYVINSNVRRCDLALRTIHPPRTSTPGCACSKHGHWRKLARQPCSGLLAPRSVRTADRRGSFEELYRLSSPPFTDVNPSGVWPQVSTSRSLKNTLRGPVAAHTFLLVVVDRY
jgi:hypothetical protein